MEKNSILVGIIVGSFVPIVGYALLLYLYEFLSLNGFLDSLSDSFIERTPALLAICLNLVPFRYFNNNYMTASMRGMIFPTIAFVVYWWYHFHVSGSFSFLTQ